MLYERTLILRTILEIKKKQLYENHSDIWVLYLWKHVSDMEGQAFNQMHSVYIFFCAPNIITGLYLSGICIPLPITFSKFEYAEYGNGISFGAEI